MSANAGENLLRIGLSLPFREAEELTSFRDLPECFELLELSGELVLNAANIRQENPLLQEFEGFNFRNLMPSSLTGMLDAGNTAIIQEYKKQLRELMAKAHQCRAEYVSLDPDWEALFNNEARCKVFNDILRSTAGDREYYNLQMAVTVRMPGSGELPIPRSMELLHKLSNYKVKLALDIYPHELRNNTIDWVSILQHFRFDTACIRFCYLSELGNKLLYQHIQPVVEVLKSFRREFDIYIAPSGKADLQELSDMVKNITSEGSAE